MEQNLLDDLMHPHAHHKELGDQFEVKIGKWKIFSAEMARAFSRVYCVYLAALDRFSEEVQKQVDDHLKKVESGPTVLTWKKVQQQPISHENEEKRETKKRNDFQEDRTGNKKPRRDDDGNRRNQGRGENKNQRGGGKRQQGNHRGNNQSRNQANKSRDQAYSPRNALPNFIQQCPGKVWCIDVDEDSIPQYFMQVLKMGLEFIFQPPDEYLIKEFEQHEVPHNTRLNNEVVRRVTKSWKHLKKKVKVLPTDKNMGCSIISIDTYTRLKMDLLNDEKTFQRLNVSQEELINAYLQDLMEFEYLLAYISPESDGEQHCLPVFSGIPKVHKTPIKLRPIVNCSRVITTPLSEFLHEILIMVIKNCKFVNAWMIENTKEFTDKLDHCQTLKGFKIYTADIQSLYTNIQHEALMKALRFMLDNFRAVYYVFLPRKEPIYVSNTDVMGLIELYLKYNFCIDPDTDMVYKQVQGIPTGGNCSPDLANLFLMYYEIQYKTDHPFEWYKHRMMGRYLDDLMVLTNNPQFDWQEIQHKVYEDTIVLEDNSLTGHTSGIFLDIVVWLHKETGEVLYRLYRKPGNAYQYIHRKSYLPWHIKRAFIRHEIQRIRQRCKLDYDFEREQDFFLNMLVKRGYTEKLIHKIQADREPREQNDCQDGQRKEMLILPYSHLLPEDLWTRYRVVFSNQRKLKDYLK